MAGIYIHIPFCKKACHYCDFHFSTSLKYKSEMIASLLKEIEIQKDYLGEEKVETIYFGGGTPSLLEADTIKEITDHIGRYFNVVPEAEITLEANPDDLDSSKVMDLRGTPINRFSIGIQSFFEEDLVWMNRSHGAIQAESAIKRIQDAGFENISADLIYGFPLLNDQKWAENIQKMIDFEIAHISCYALTVEQGTALHHFIQKGKQKPVNESQSARQFVQLIEKLNLSGFIHYEISNFSLPSRESKHNTSYWKGAKYLGIGPSAHSFNGSSRQWNVANNAQYLSAIALKEIPAKTETLSLNNRFNEYIMISLRTIWGVDLSYLRSEFGESYFYQTEEKIRDFTDKDWVQNISQKLILTAQGKLFADHIASELFILDDE